MKVSPSINITESLFSVHSSQFFVLHSNFI